MLQLPEVWPHAFTLPELVRRGEGVRARPSEKTMSAWFDQVHQGRERKDMIGTMRRDDVADPYGGPDAGYRRMASTLAELTDRLGLLCGYPALRMPRTVSLFR